MAIQRDGYYYNQQLKTYIRQFMAIFSGLQVQIGKWNDKDERLITVPIHYAHMDRVVASIFSDNTQNKPLRLPLMSAYLRTIELNKAYMAGNGMERRNSYLPVGGEASEDTVVVYQRRPVPYKLGLDLTLYASNTDQHFQMLEQITPLFGPSLQIQTSDAPFDMKLLSMVELTGTQLETNYPIGSDRRVIVSTMSFEMPIWIDIPADIRRNFIEKIFVRVGAVSMTDTTNFEIIADLDAQGIPYELVLSDEDLKID